MKVRRDSDYTVITTILNKSISFKIISYRIGEKVFININSIQYILRVESAAFLILHCPFKYLQR